jgi:hypothetical protein
MGAAARCTTRACAPIHFRRWNYALFPAVACLEFSFTISGVVLCLDDEQRVIPSMAMSPAVACLDRSERAWAWQQQLRRHHV